MIDCLNNCRSAHEAYEIAIAQPWVFGENPPYHPKTHLPVACLADTFHLLVCKEAMQRDDSELIERVFKVHKRFRKDRSPNYQHFLSQLMEHSVSWKWYRRMLQHLTSAGYQSPPPLLTKAPKLLATKIVLYNLWPHLITLERIHCLPILHQGALCLRLYSFIIELMVCITVEPRLLQCQITENPFSFRPDEQPHEGDTMLMVAARLGFLNVCQWLLSNGCKEGINLKGINGNTALHMASDCNIVRLLLACGANPMLTNDEGKVPSQVTGLGVDKCRYGSCTLSRHNVDPRKEEIHSKMLTLNEGDELSAELVRLLGRKEWAEEERKKFSRRGKGCLSNECGLLK